MGNRRTTIWVSESVWKAISELKEIGDSMDTVLRRILNLDPEQVGDAKT